MTSATIIRVSAPIIREVEGSIEYASEVSGLPGETGSRRLWIRFEDAEEAWVSSRGDAFLATLLPVAMATGRPLENEGVVSQRLLRRITRIQSMLTSWHPQLQQVQVRAHSAPEPGTSEGAIASFFSGGVDSFFSALESLQEETGQRRISDLVYVEGFDLQLSNVDLLHQVRGRMGAAAEALSLPLRIARTNSREITDRFTPWDTIQHGPSLAGLGLALSGYCGEVRIPASDTVDRIVPYGSHVLLDPLWSSEATRVIQSGSDTSRMQKVEWEIAQSTVALSHLRVCWENRGGRYNCGECGKCLRTMMALRAAGVLDRAETFDRPLDLGFLKRNREYNFLLDYYGSEIIESLEASGKDPDLLEELRAFEKRQQRLKRRSLSPLAKLRSKAWRKRVLRPFKPREKSKRLKSALRIGWDTGEGRAVATRAISPGATIAQLDGTQVSEPTHFTVQIGEQEHLDPQGYAPDERGNGVRAWGYLNHVCEPNAAVHGRTLLALRPIAHGEEVSIHYAATEFEMAEPFTCHCGGANCLGELRGYRPLSAQDRDRISEIVQPHVLAAAQRIR